jgi:hypothetical protein
MWSSHPTIDEERPVAAFRYRFLLFATDTTYASSGRARSVLPWCQELRRPDAEVAMVSSRGPSPVQEPAAGSHSRRKEDPTAGGDRQAMGGRARRCPVTLSDATVGRCAGFP